MRARRHISGLALPFRAFVLGIAGLCFAGTAPAQYVSSTQDNRTTPIDPSQAELARADADFREMLRCVADRVPTRIDALLDTVPGSKAETNIVMAFSSRLDWCFPDDGAMRFSWALLRGGLAETAYHRDFSKRAAVSLAASDSLTAWTMPRPGGKGTEQLALVHSAARCMVASHPDAVRSLLSTQPVSTAELEQLRALRAKLGPCLYSGVTFTTNRQSLRGLLAEAMLDYSRGARKGGALAVTVNQTKNAN